MRVLSSEPLWGYHTDEIKSLDDLADIDFDPKHLLFVEEDTKGAFSQSDVLEEGNEGVFIEPTFRLLPPSLFADDLLAFFADRLKVALKEQGVRHDLIDAVFALGEDDLVAIVKRVEALQAFLATEDGENLLAGYKRASSILDKEGYQSSSLPPGGGGIEGEGGSGANNPLTPNPSRTRGEGNQDQGEDIIEAILNSDQSEPAERALAEALKDAEPKAQAAIEAEDFEAAMAAIAPLRAAIDAFFDSVTVNADDPELRTNRLRLLARIRASLQAVADFDKIESR